jgi:hypothetical protein
LSSCGLPRMSSETPNPSRRYGFRRHAMLTIGTLLHLGVSGSRHIVDTATETIVCKWLLRPENITV